ncbi:RNA polymerase sigma factor [Paucisalibacillus sp. EB02]|uniref:RNA polymerase sigma factor n=1 Tax=Paucisalibacillus sp. EB02 TaxID=1347087 RepID=UPI0004BC0C98|nr:hypothetical protein [Paucisalibacillus sp. EB02]
MHEEELVKRIRERDHAAFEHLIDQYKTIIEKFLFQYGVEPNRISDVVKEVFVKIAQKAESFEQGTMFTRIHQIMIQTIKNDDRRRKKAQKITGNTTDSTHYGYYFERPDHISNQMNLREMNSKYKVPIIFKHFCDKQSDEITTILKTNEANLIKMIQQGEKLLEEEFQKTSILHQDRNLHDSLGEMIYAYQRLPEFTEKQEILVSIDLARKSHKWKKILPTFGAVLGLFLFALFGLNYIQEQKVELKAAQEEERAAARKEAAEAVAYTEPKEQVYEIDPEIQTYMEQAIENFAMELGMEDVSRLPVVQNVRSMVEELKRTPDMFGGVDDTKNYIDMMLTLPSTLLEKLASPSDGDSYSFMEVLGISFMYESEFQSYLQELIASIPVDEYEQIFELQDSPSDYPGQEEIQNFLRIINKQGYEIDIDRDYGYLMVKLDLEEFKGKLADKGYGEAYLSYVDFTVSQYTIDWSDWSVLGDTLLDIETLYIKYGDSYGDGFLEHLYNDMANYLNQYLRTWDGQETVYETEKEEYFQFLENHPDSIYWDVINSTLQDWEENDWKRTQDFISVEKFWFQLDDRFKNVKYDDIIELNRWSFTTNTGAVYRDYSSNLDPNLLTELKPLEIVSLFAYAHEKEDSNTYTTIFHSMNMEQELEEDLFNIRNKGGYGLTEFTSENTAIVYFVDWNKNLLASVELMIENGIWKIMQ